MSSRRDRMSKLKCLVEELSDRDKQLKEDAKLFHDFFLNFPIPVTMWSLDESGNVISKKGNTIIKDDGTQLNNMFADEYSEDFKNAHTQAYNGENVSFFSVLPDKTYYTRLVPRGEKEVTGLTGISWDITSNYTIIKSLDEIKKLASKKSVDLSKIQELASRALDASRIKKLLPGEE